VFCWKLYKTNPPANQPKKTTNWRVLVYFGYKVQNEIKNHKIKKKRSKTQGPTSGKVKFPDLITEMGLYRHRHRQQH
jgi:hypothetical protein